MKRLVWPGFLYGIRSSSAIHVQHFQRLLAVVLYVQNGRRQQTCRTQRLHSQSDAFSYCAHGSKAGDCRSGVRGAD